MERIALLNKKGTTLIELLASMTILAIVAVALMQSSIVVLQSNVRNETRDEAVAIAGQRMNELRSGPGGFDGEDLVDNIDLAGDGSWTITRTIRQASIPFTVRKAIVSLPDGDTKQVTVTVEWWFRGQQYSHSVMSIVRRYGS